jgi:mRNA-degrading endonuclease toxin of MazEF toxin-antitoxin module
MAVVATTEPKTGFHIKVPDGLKVKGTILVDQVTMIDWKVRSFAKEGYLPPHCSSGKT